MVEEDIAFFLDPLLPFPDYGGQPDPYCHLLIQIDPEEYLAARYKQKVYLARYARQSVFEWEHREVAELQKYFDELVNLVERENKGGANPEDR